MKKHLSDYPKLVKEFHPTKNDDLKPENLTYGSNKKVWWKCSNNNEHEWEAITYNRCKGTGCPFCYVKKKRNIRKASKTYNLLITNPLVAKEWHPTKNENLKPEHFTHGSEKKVWFSCTKSKSHNYQARIADKTKGKWECPFWSAKQIGNDNNLEFKFPEIAREWHPKRNKDVTPDKIAPHSNKFFWWVCDKGHEYRMQSSERTLYSQGCNKCSRFGGSAQETRIYCELKTLFPNAKFRHKIEGKEIDIFIPSINIGIEYDGEFYHRNKVDADIAKNSLMENQGVRVLRVREYPLDKISNFDIVSTKRGMTKNDLDKLLKSILHVAPSTDKIVTSYLKEKEFVNQKQFLVYMSYFPSPFPEKSLAQTYPEVSKQWDYEKNHPLTPYNFTHGSKHKVFWICKNRHSHETTINHKT